MVYKIYEWEQIHRFRWLEILIQVDKTLISQKESNFSDPVECGVSPNIASSNQIAGALFACEICWLTETDWLLPRIKIVLEAFSGMSYFHLDKYFQTFFEQLQTTSNNNSRCDSHIQLFFRQTSIQLSFADHATDGVIPTRKFILRNICNGNKYSQRGDFKIEYKKEVVGERKTWHTEYLPVPFDLWNRYSKE